MSSINKLKRAVIFSLACSWVIVSIAGIPRGKDLIYDYWPLSSFRLFTEYNVGEPMVGWKYVGRFMNEEGKVYWKEIYDLQKYFAIPRTKIMYRGHALLMAKQPLEQYLYDLIVWYEQRRAKGLHDGDRMLSLRVGLVKLPDDFEWNGHKMQTPWFVAGSATLKDPN